MIRNKIGKGKPIFGKIKLRKEEALKFYPNIKKIKRLINWYPKVAFDQGINRTINYYKKSLSNYKKN